jgi:phospholipid/cholesterol/gamma-HCH transport system permease protein
MDFKMTEAPNAPKLTVLRPETSTVVLEISGNWKLETRLPDPSEVREQIESCGGCKRLAFDTARLTGWDSALLAFLIKVYAYCRSVGIQSEPEGLPKGVARLLAMAMAAMDEMDVRTARQRPSIMARIGEQTIKTAVGARQMIDFIGEASVAFSKLVTRKAHFQRPMLVLLLQQCGVDALPIVSLISLLVGLILAFVGAIQLRLFGAQIYVADLVGLAMVREMGAMMTGIIMAGRTGAAFAAQLGTMQVNEEIDAFITMGISPMEFLVLPRMLALGLMTPLLCLYANLLGMLGGGLVGVAMLGITPTQYFIETQNAVHFADFSAGLFKGVVFGVLVALSGCLRGIQCGRSASAVGDATTSAVVTAIVAIIVSDAILTVLYDILGV